MDADEDRRRLALAHTIMGVEYRRGVAWLKVVPVADVTGAQVAVTRQRTAGRGHAATEAARRGLLEELFARHFYDWTPEDSPYSEFNAGPWRHAERAEMERVLDAVLATTEVCLEQDAKEHAEACALADEVGDERPTDVWTDTFADYAALRRWFIADLWPGPDVSWFTLNGGGVHAVVAVDDLLIGVLWGW